MFLIAAAAMMMGVPLRGLLLALALRGAAGMKDGLDIQLFACNPLSVRQAWRHNASSGRLQLVWQGVDPPLTQAMAALPPGGGTPPRSSDHGQLSTWSTVTGAPNASDVWDLKPAAAGATTIVHRSSGRCAMAASCSWSTATRNCHDGQCHDASACPVVLGDCGAPGALFTWNASSGHLVSRLRAGRSGKLKLCLDAGTTYPNTACEFDDGDEALPFCDPALPTHVRAADLVGRMTLAEQLQQLLTEAPAIP